MKLDVIANGQRGVINITSDQFIIEDLKTHVCKKLKLIESDFKVKVACGDNPSIELIKTPSLSFNQQKEEDFKFNLDSARSRKELAKKLEGEISKLYPSVDFVTVKETSFSKEKTAEISVFFSDTPDGEAITYFGAELYEYNQPLHKTLKSRIEKVYKIIYPFLGVQ